MNIFFGHFNGSDSNLNNSRSFGKDNRFRICFSGELYNYSELFSDLVPDSKILNDKSIESLIYVLFLNRGINFAANLNGNFTIYIADRKESILYLVRDHIGISRLYFCKEGRNLYFSDSIKRLFTEYPRLDDELDIVALNYYFKYRYIPSDLTIFKRIKKLGPGNILIFKPLKDIIETKSYWQPPLREPGHGDEIELTGELDKLLRKSVSRRLDADGNGSALLSGGLDSSLNVALMREMGAERIKTFTIGFDDRKYDETEYSRMVADHFGTDHTQIVVKSDPGVFDKIGEIFEEPNGDPSVFPTFHLSALVKGKCSSLICGDGADGLFLGLKTHQMLSTYLKVHPYLKGMYPAISHLSQYFPDSLRWKVFLEGLSPEQFFLRRRTYFSDQDRQKLFKQSIIDELGEDFYSPEIYGREILNQYEGSTLGKAGYFTYSSNPHDILVKMGRLMGISDINIRTPFLDKDVVSFALGSIGSNLKIKNGISKYILKIIAGRYLPPELPVERKRGFNPPVKKWIRDDWWDYICEMIINGDSEYIDTGYAEHLLKNHRKNFFDESRRIFPLFMFRLWEKRFRNNIL